MLSPIESVTHAHLVYAAAAEIERRGSPSSITLLDVGCGNGQLLLAVHRHLARLIGSSVDLYGFDVSDARVQRTDFFAATLGLLQRNAPSLGWHDRLSLVESTDAWPVASASMDVVLTNQVLEHVPNLAHFMDELYRVLRPGGVCVNLFPVRSMLVESHVGAPLAHRVASDDVRQAYLCSFARHGLSRVGPMRIGGSLSPSDFAVTRSEYVASQVWYRSFRELADAAHHSRLLASYRWTPEFYALKLGYLTGRDVSAIYVRGAARVLLDWLSFPILSRVSSVTMVLEKGEAYNPDSPDAGHLG